MAVRDELDFHAQRALDELDCARAATSETVALAHLELSELHLARIRALGKARARPSLRLVDGGPDANETYIKQKVTAC